MANRFFTFVSSAVAGALARVGPHVNEKFTEVDAGFTEVESELNRCIRFIDGTPTESEFQIGLTAEQRKNLVLAFDANGGIAARALGFAWQGDWATETTYAVNDVVRGPESTSFSLYICTVEHESAIFSEDLNAENWEVLVDLSGAPGSVNNRVLTATTSASGQVEMLADGSRLTLPDFTTWAFEIHLAARRSDNPNESAGYRFYGVIDRNSGAASVALVGSLTEVTDAEDVAWVVTVDADTANGSLRVRVTGESGKTIRWVANVKTVAAVS